MDELTNQEQLVYDLLPRGIENSRTYKQLNLNVDKRAFFQVINSLRLKGKSDWCNSWKDWWLLCSDY